MYWLAGLADNGRGRLFSFEPNRAWAALAKDNFETVSRRFELVAGTFEDNIAQVTRPVMISFIDAIHTRDHVLRQFELVKSVSAPRAVVLFDDINFSEEMKQCWLEIQSDPLVLNAWKIGHRIGMVQLGAEKLP